MSDDPTITERQALFWDMAESYLSEPDVEEGTLMGNPCLRISGDFMATIHRKSGDLVVKLDADRVAEIIDAGAGTAFAPAGKVFREWVAVTDYDIDVWEQLLTESLRTARTTS